MGPQHSGAGFLTNGNSFASPASTGQCGTHLLLPSHSFQCTLRDINIGNPRIVLLFTLIIYILAGRVIFNLRDSLRRFAGAEHSSSSHTGPTRDTLGTRSSSVRPGSISPGPVHDSGASAVVNPLTSYSCTISSGSGGKEPPLTVTRTRNSGVEANTAAWAYCRCAMLFFLALIITWVCVLYDYLTSTLESAFAD
jgi:hypothetical protein